MNIILYKNLAESNRLDKTAQLTEIISVNGTLRVNTSITQPVMEVENTSYLNANYAYIPEFERYYFITDIVSTNYGLWELHMKVDVLMSFKTQILGLNCLVARNENKYNKYIKDLLLPFSEATTKSFKRVRSKMFGGSQSDGNYYPPDSNFRVGLSVNIAHTNGSQYPNTIPPYTPSTGVDGGFTSRFPAKPLGTASSGVAYDTYIFYGGIMYDFLEYISTNEKARSYVLNMFLVPSYSKDIYYECGIIYQYEEEPTNSYKRYTTDKIEMGDETFYFFKGSFDIDGQEKKGTVIMARVGRGFISFDDIIDFNENYGEIKDFTNYKPYTSYSLFIPYYGFYEIDIRKMIFNGVDADTHLLLNHNIDMTDGSDTLAIYASNGANSYKRLLDIITFDVLFPMPINTSSADSVSRSRSANTARLNNGLISSLITEGIGIATQNPVLMGGGVISFISSIANYKANEVTNVQWGKVSNVRSISGMEFTCMDYLCVIEKANNVINVGDENYRKIVGIPLKEFHYLSELSGFTTIDDCHVENINCMNTESDEIYSKLREGVILPNAE